jgi:plastocyanin
MASVRTVIAASIVVAVAGLSVHSLLAAGPARRPVTKTAGPAPAAKAQVVRVVGEDFKFDAPDVVSAGLTEFRFLNKGPSLHHMALLKLEGGKTIDDLRALLAKPSGPPPAWVKEVGGPNAPAPGMESNVTTTLEPGNYALICFVDLGGPPHFTKGMVKGLTVTGNAATTRVAPKADLTATLFDYNFKLSNPVRAGTRTIRVYNSAKQHHEVELVQLAPGASTADFMNWLGKMEGPPPGKAIGGVAGIDSGMSQSFTADFAPGKYALICFLPDAKDGKPHFMHGMVQEITVE